MAPRLEIVSLRSKDGGSTWQALVLEGEKLGHFRFSAPSAEEARELIHSTAVSFDRTRSALAQLRDLDRAA